MASRLLFKIGGRGQATQSCPRSSNAQTSCVRLEYCQAPQTLPSHVLTGLDGQFVGSPIPTRATMTVKKLIRSANRFIGTVAIRCCRREDVRGGRSSDDRSRRSDRTLGRDWLRTTALLFGSTEKNID